MVCGGLAAAHGRRQLARPVETALTWLGPRQEPDGALVLDQHWHAAPGLPPRRPPPRPACPTGCAAPPRRRRLPALPPASAAPMSCPPTRCPEGMRSRGIWRPPPLLEHLLGRDPGPDWPELAAAHAARRARPPTCSPISWRALHPALAALLAGSPPRSTTASLPRTRRSGCSAGSTGWWSIPGACSRSTSKATAPCPTARRGTRGDPAPDGRHRSALAAIWPGRSVETAILWTRAARG